MSNAEHAPRELSQEELRARCEGLIEQEAISSGQFADFVESLCLLAGRPFACRLVDLEAGEMVTLRYARNLTGDIFDREDITVGMSFSGDSSSDCKGSHLIEESLYLFPGGEVSHVVRFSPIIPSQDTLYETIATTITSTGEPSKKLAAACRKTWEIYSHSQKPQSKI